MNLNYGEITDPVELEKLWQEYLFDSANLVGISRDFSNVKEIDPFLLFNRFYPVWHRAVGNQ